MNESKKSVQKKKKKKEILLWKLWAFISENSATHNAEKDGTSKKLNVQKEIEIYINNNSNSL